MNSDLGPVPQLGFQTPERIPNALRVGDDERVCQQDVSKWSLSERWPFTVSRA